jgi:hypothetical protein
MKKETTPNHTKAIPQIENKNRQFTEASFAKLMLEGEGDTFWFHFKHKTSPNSTKVIPQTENKKPSASKPASLN